MIRSEKPINRIQLHLPILAPSKAAVSDEKQKELAAALVELLISAAPNGDDEKRTGEGEDELEADR